MKNFDAVQDLLKGLGYKEKQVERAFVRGDVEISFDEIPKHTVATFLEKARAKGWVTDDEVRQKMGEAPPVLDPTGIKAPFSAYARFFIGEVDIGTNHALVEIGYLYVSGVKVDILGVNEDILTGRIKVKFRALMPLLDVADPDLEEWRMR